MNLKFAFGWLFNHLSNYNIFLPDENEYNNESQDSVRQQKYTTWFYVLLLATSIYILFYAGLMREQSETIFIHNVTPIIFDELYSKHYEKLTCPCSTITIPYKTFVNNTNTFHPVCSSIFVTEQWIQLSAFANASLFGTADFRTTASSQFQLLANICSFMQNTTLQNEIDLDNTEFVSINLQSNIEIQSKVNATVESFYNSLSNRINSFLSYVKITSQTNFFVSALNTNIVVAVNTIGSEYEAYLIPTIYTNDYYDKNTINYEYVSCANANPFTTTGFLVFPTGLDSYRLIWTPPNSNSTLVKGFFAGCTPLEGLLRSTLDCLYDISCIDLLLNYFPNLHQIAFNWTNLLLETNKNLSMYNYLSDLLIEKQITTINYSKYFNECAPHYCVYTKTRRLDFHYSITLFISLYGGLVIILRLIALFIINLILNYHTWNLISVKRLIESVKQLNLFKNVDDRMENGIKRQKLVTKVYLILMFGSILTLMLFNSLHTQTITMIKQSPSWDIYQQLQYFYSTTLDCPCSSMVISYDKFISFSPVLHPVCSSDFVTDRWLSILSQSILYDISVDWRNQAFSQVQLLANLCQSANGTINDAIRRFLSQYFVTSSVLSENNFQSQINSTVNELFLPTISYFGLLVETVRLLMQIDQPLIGSKQGDIGLGSTIAKTFSIDELENQQMLQLIMLLIGVHNTNLTATDCICATNPNCKSALAIYAADDVNVYGSEFDIVYVVPGSFTGCSTTESLLLSTLECFYEDSDCFTILMKYIKQVYIYNVETSLWFDVQPLVYNSQLSNYPPNTPISIIVKKLMVEEWNLQFSYENFYESCSPKYCTYSERLHANTLLEVIRILISMTSGLSFTLRFATPYLVKFVINVITRNTNRQAEQQANTVYNTLKNLNIFSIRDFRSHLDRITAKRLGQMATRLYIVLFLIGIAIFTSYNVTQPYIGTRTFDKPSFDKYRDLYGKYKDQLECSCSSIATTYDQFVSIESSFHQICSSTFVMDEWRTNLTIRLEPNLSIYSLNDYRRFLPSHLQYLQGLCRLSDQSVNNTIEQFLPSSFVTNQLLFEKHFNDSIYLRIENSISTAPTIFLTLLSLIRKINHGNAIVST
ncbi:unnamed protein product [Adineta ricciae]|uniref:Uncharacterized protein n=1 Tax=Adineta ricciae TaxID=249248 RepID=A0A815JP86_ADIRI|nr:unnamed protein product [Adineta ricciae]CAF1517547.1 unnamed protein product [Adineta ricciae]